MRLILPRFDMNAAQDQKEAELVRIIADLRQIIDQQKEQLNLVEKVSSKLSYLEDSPAQHAFRFLESRVL